MPYKNALSPKKPYLDVNSNKSSSAIVGRLANQFGIKLGVTTSLLATIYLSSSSQVVNAADLILDRDTTKQNFFQEKNTPTSLPRVFSTIASTSLIPQTLFTIYTVKPGDTLDGIAIQHQVSRDELVKLNKINNSNIIFVNQRLKIPTKATDNALLDIKLDEMNDSSVESYPVTVHPHQELKLASTNSASDVKQKSTPVDSFELPTKASAENRPNSAKLSNKVNSTPTKEDPHLVKLKAEIEQMQTQERDRLQQQTSNTAFTLPNLPPAEHSQPNHSTEENPQKTFQQVAVVASATPQHNLKPNLPLKKTISLQLPPLPPSEEYLPRVFEGYIWPAEGVLTSHYGWRWGRLHRGIDIAAPVGTPVLAAASGTVINAGWHSGYGNLIKLKHSDGSITLYAHNHRNLVSHGQQVERGEQIAEMGSTGHSTGSHLHFEIHFEDEGAVNPLVLLGSR
ncbi:peptidoglycan DD-metalloendopeptidase family protein [Pleurocapsales cyanobacterium LEGE 10410]|nr:peptidoglycan DD-metalloendopeptidase family protein [Pleurocapsales cyanobacterium LEGE 10410]